MPIEALSPASLRRALVIKLRHHGDVLLASFVISMLKRIAPQCEVDALVYVDTAPMLENQLSPKELTAPMAMAWIKLFVGTDSATMNIALTKGKTVVNIFLASGYREWASRGERCRVVASMTRFCRLCGLAGCNDSKTVDCLTTLPVAQVLAACEELLA